MYTYIYIIYISQCKSWGHVEQVQIVKWYVRKQGLSLKQAGKICVLC